MSSFSIVGGVGGGAKGKVQAVNINKAPLISEKNICLIAT